MPQRQSFITGDDDSKIKGNRKYVRYPLLDKYSVIYSISIVNKTSIQLSG